MRPIRCGGKSGASKAILRGGEALLKSAVLYMLIAFTFSLLAHLSASVFDSVAPAVVASLCMMALPLAPGYYGEFSSYREVAPWLPSTYLWVEYAAGSIDSAMMPGARPLLGVSFVCGCVSRNVRAWRFARAAGSGGRAGELTLAPAPPLLTARVPVIRRWTKVLRAPAWRRGHLIPHHPLPALCSQHPRPFSSSHPTPPRWRACCSAVRRSTRSPLSWRRR